MESMEESSSYRAGLGLVNARLHSYAWIILLPAAAECTASVYYPSISLGGLDLQLAVLNVSGRRVRRRPKLSRPQEDTV